MVRFTPLGGFGVLCICLLAWAGVAGPHVEHGQPPDPFANCWQDLAAADPGQAYRATWLLAQHPAEAAKLLRQHLIPASVLDLAQIQTWLSDLDSEKYAVRVKAFQELEKQGELAEPQLRKVLDGNPPLETRQRAQMLLDRLQGPLSSAEKLRMIRAVEVLEMTGTDEAKEFLQQLAKGEPRHRLTQEAQDSLKRLQERRSFAGTQAGRAPKLAAQGNAGDPLPFGASARLGTTLFRSPMGPRPGMASFASFSSDSRLVAVAVGKTVCLWEARTGKLHRKLDYSAYCLAMSTKSTLLALGQSVTNRDGNGIVLWDWRAEKEVARIALPLSVSPQQVSFTPNDTQLLAKCSDNSLRAWDVATWKESTLWKQGNPGMRDGLVAFSPDGRRVLVGGQAAQISSILDLQKDAKVPLEGQDNYPHDRAFSPDAKYLAGGSFAGPRLWDAVTGKLLRVQADGTGGFTRSLAFSADCKLLAAAYQDKGIFLWDVPTGRFLKGLPASESFRVGAISPDSRWLAGVGDSSLRVWDLETGQAVNDGEGHVENIRSLAISPGFDAIATGGQDGTLRLWDPATGKQKLLLMNEPTRWVADVAFSADGKWLASSDLRYDSSVRVWEVATGRQVLKLLGHGQNGGKRKLQFSPDGRYLFSWGDDFYLRKWDVKTGKALLEYRTRPTGMNLPEDDDNEDRRQAAQLAMQMNLFISDGAFTPQADQFLLAIGQRNLHFFDVATGKETRVVKSSSTGVNSLAISPTGKHVVLSGNDGRTGFSMTVVELASGKVVFNAAFPGGAYGQAEFSPDGRTVAAACGDKIVVVETASGKTRLTVDSLPIQTHHLAFSHDGRSLVTAMDDTTAMVWDLAVLAGRKQP